MEIAPMTNQATNDQRPSNRDHALNCPCPQCQPHKWAQDAKRYRWLKERIQCVSLDREVSFVTPTGQRIYVRSLCGMELDGAIDQNISAVEPPEKS